MLFFAIILLLFLRIANPAHEDKPIKNILIDESSGTATVAVRCGFAKMDALGMLSDQSRKSKLAGISVGLLTCPVKSSCKESKVKRSLLPALTVSVGDGVPIPMPKDAMPDWPENVV